MSDAKPTERTSALAPDHDGDLHAALADVDATVAACQRPITSDLHPVPPGGLDRVVVPGGYSAQVFLAAGTPISGACRSLLPQGGSPEAELEQRVGHQHVGLHYFPLAPGAIGNRAGVLCLNHESVPQDLLWPDGPALSGGKRSGEEEVRQEIAAHGVTVVEVYRQLRGREWQVAESRYNRRITGATPMELSGPVRGSKWVRTKYSPAGTRVRGTLNNGAHGVTPWGTYLACEMNWSGYFVNRALPQPREHARYHVATTAGRYRWEDIPADDCERFDATPVAGGSAEQDYRNEPNGFGWVVEIDPFAPRSVPRKRTALGRLAHDTAWFEPATPGRPLVVYLGDGSPREYLYKFVTRDEYRPGQTDGDCLDDGILYVARFDDDGSGEWLALDPALPGFRAAAAAKHVVFEDQADVLVNTRLAADVVGATRRDGTDSPAVHSRVASPEGHLIRRLLKGVPACKVTGFASTPNGRTLFANIQHPGEHGAPRAASKGASSWPDGATARPRSAVVIVTRDDGGIVGP